jgi:hypothetical protein
VTRTFTIALFACAIAMATDGAAQTLTDVAKKTKPTTATKTSQSDKDKKKDQDKKDKEKEKETAKQDAPAKQEPTPTTTQKSGTPDEWKFTKEKEAEKSKADTSTDSAKPPAVVPADKQPDSWKMSKEKAQKDKAADDKAASKAEKSDAKAAKADAKADAKAQKRTAAAAKPKTPWRGWSDRALISLNGGQQASSHDFSDSRTFAPAIQGDPERRTMNTSYSVKSAPLFDLGGTVRMWKGLGVGVAVTRFKKTDDVPVDGTVPHPFFFNRARSVGGVASGSRQETAVHVDATWVVPVNNRMTISLFGGPTFYNVKQTVVSDYTFSESYPYDEAAFGNAVLADESKSVAGFNGGVDVGYYFTHAIGVGGVVRFGSAKVDTSLGSLDVGGASFGIGVRIRVPQGKPASRPTTPPPPRRRPAPKK